MNNYDVFGLLTAALPVSITERLLQMLPDNGASCYPVICIIQNKKGIQRFHQSRGISYTTARDIIKTNLGVFFEDLRKLKTHSLQSGGASDPGCKDLSDMAVQSHGGWKSVQSHIHWHTWNLKCPKTYLFRQIA